MDFCESIFFDEICQVTAFACDFQYRAVCPVLIVYIFSLSSIVIVFRILPEILISCFPWSLNDPVMLFITLCCLSKCFINAFVHAISAV